MKRDRYYVLSLMVAGLVFALTCSACGGGGGGSGESSSTKPSEKGKPLPNYHHICLEMARGARLDDSAFSPGVQPYVRECNPVAFQQYYQKHDGGGLNDTHITTDYTNVTGDNYVSDAQSGTFYITDTGGRGYADEVILLVSINTTQVSPITSLRIQSSGYQVVTDALQEIVSYTFVTNALDETFAAEDFIYGPQTWKPSGTALYPLWIGEDVNNTSNSSLLTFIDLNVGKVKEGMIPGATYNGAAKVDYSFTGLNGRAVFNVYGYAIYSNQGQGISWTNRTDGITDYSGYVVNPPPEEDEDFDFEATLRDIYTELAEKSQKNFEDLGI